VGSVEIHDVAIPVVLPHATSRQVHAEREKPVRVILGSAEAAICRQTPWARSRRQMRRGCPCLNMLPSVTMP
jgi:hypothetical protein